MQSHNYQSIFEGIRNIPVLPELSVPHTARFLVSTEKEILYSLIAAHDIIIPSGAFFGDEGKGRAVKAIAQHPDVELVARLNSGENAGHTNFDEFMHKFIFNLAPSGLLIPGKKNVIGPNCVMDPISFMEKEMQQLIDAGIEYLNRLTIGNVMIVTPYHKIMDALGKPNSSTMKGMSPVHTSKVTKKGLRLDHVFNSPDIQRARLQEDMEMYYGALHAKGMSETQVLEQLTELNKDLKRIPDHVINFLKAKNKIDYIIDLYEDGVKNNDNFPRRGDVTHIIQQTLESRKKVLIEPAQSFFLSNNVETHWSSSTSADTTAAGTLAAAGVNVSKYRVLFYNIHKTPAPSRVGLGSNPAGYVPQDYFSSQHINTLKDLEGICEDFDNIQRKFSEAIQENGVLNPIEYKDASGNTYLINEAMAIASSKHHEECGATTKKPRVCGLFDCVAHHRVNKAQGPYLSISAMDRGDDYDKVGLIIAYIVYDPNKSEMDSQGRKYKNGDIIKPGDPMPCESVLEHCYPIIREYDGWKSSPIGSGKRKPNDTLPKQVQEFLAGIVQYTGAHIISIGTGPRSDDLIYINQN